MHQTSPTPQTRLPQPLLAKEADWSRVLRLFPAGLHDLFQQPISFRTSAANICQKPALSYHTFPILSLLSRDEPSRGWGEQDHPRPAQAASAESQTRSGSDLAARERATDAPTCNYDKGRSAQKENYTEATIFKFRL